MSETSVEVKKFKKNEKRKQDLQSLGVEGPVTLSQTLKIKLVLKDESWICPTTWKDIARAARAARKLEKKRKREEAMRSNPTDDTDSPPEPESKRPRGSYPDEEEEEEEDQQLSVEESETDLAMMEDSKTYDADLRATASDQEIENTENLRMELDILSSKSSWERNQRNVDEDEEGQPPPTMTIQTRRAARNQRTGQQMSTLDEKEEQSKRELQALRRQQKEREKLEDEKNQIVEQLLCHNRNTQSNKRVSHFMHKGIFLESSSQNGNGFRLSFSDDCVPYILQGPAHPPSGPSTRYCHVCSAPQKYKHSVLQVPLCSLKCYQIVSKQ